MDLVGALDGNLKLEVAHVFSLTKAEGVVEELLLELGHFGPDVAVLVVPLVNCGTGGVSGELVLAAGLLEVVVDGDRANPAGLLSLVLESRLINLVDRASESGSAEGVALLVVVTGVMRDSDAVAAGIGLPVSHCG